MSLAFNSYVTRHRLPIGLSLLVFALIGGAVASRGLTLEQVLRYFPF